MMRRRRDSASALLIVYFLFIIAVGTLLLWIDGRQAIDGGVSFVDALFTATSAACVTGLYTINTPEWSLFGQLVILFLIQAGGLGIILFSSLFVVQLAGKMSFRRRRLIREYYVSDVETEPKRIIRNILIFTFGAELIGAAVLAAVLASRGAPRPVFSGLFHAVSAFCNAGFSIYTDSLEGFVGAPGVYVTVALLIVLGGLGFVTIHDLTRFARKRRRHLSYHSKIVLLGTAFLIVAGAGAYLFLDSANGLGDLRWGRRIGAAFFQSVTTRTAGFNTVPQGELSLPSLVLTMALMVTGGAPASIAGGVKLTTMVVVLVSAISGTDAEGAVRFLGRKIPGDTVRRANAFVLKALLLLTGAVILLSAFERANPADFSQLLFEAVSAFGTVGLSTGITPTLSVPGKLVIILTMFAGRIGLITFVLPRGIRRPGPPVDYPRGTLLIG
ncbi:MAG: TrkH family potassium uptake protein [Spirochaetaceae bacterium]